MTTETTELTELTLPAPSPALLTLFGTDDPAALLVKIGTVADLLRPVFEKRGLVTKIGKSEHVRVEGWTLLGSLTGAFASVRYSGPIANGFEAHAVAHTLSGLIVGEGDGQCERTEPNWRSKPDYAIRSMAQTRAVSQAMRRPLGFIVELAGYSATPAEEMEGLAPPRESGPYPRASDTGAVRMPRGYANVGQLREEIGAAAAIRNIGAEELTTISLAAGVKPGVKATADQLRAILITIEKRPVPESEETEIAY